MSLQELSAARRIQRMNIDEDHPLCRERVKAIDRIQMHRPIKTSIDLRGVIEVEVALEEGSRAADDGAWYSLKIRKVGNDAHVQLLEWWDCQHVLFAEPDA